MMQRFKHTFHCITKFSKALRMRTSIHLLSLLFLLLLLASTGQGIRSDEQLISFLHKKVHENEGVPILHNGGEAFAERSRNLMSNTVSKAKVDKDVNSGIRSAQRKPQLRKEVVDKDSKGLNMEASNIEHKRLPPQTYPDLLDIAGMDYSPAKKKPPIHN